MVLLYIQIRFSSAVTECSSICVRGDTVGGALSTAGPLQALSARNRGNVLGDAASNWRLDSIGSKHATGRGLSGPPLTARRPGAAATRRTYRDRGAQHPWPIGWTWENIDLVIAG